MALTNELIEPRQLRFIITTSSVTDMELALSPRDWGDSSVTFKKDVTNFMANKREFSLPLGFVGDGRKALRDEYRINGVNGKALVRIDLLNPATWQYELFYEGRVDFLTADLNAEFIDVNFMDNDIQAKFTAFDNTEFEIPFEIDPEGTRDYDTILPPIYFTEFGKYFIAAQSNSSVTPLSPWSIISMGLQEYKNRMNEILLKSQNYERYPGDGFYDIAAGDNSFGRSTKAGVEMLIEGSMLYDCTNRFQEGELRGYYLVLDEVWFDESGFEIIYPNVLFDFTIHGEGVFTDRRARINKTIITQRDDSYLFVSLKTNQAGATTENVLTVNIKEAQLLMSYDAFSPADNALSMTARTLFDELVKRVTGDDAVVTQSTFLDNIAAPLLFSCGDAIRRLPDAEVVIKTSFSRFWDSISKVYDIGFDIIDGVPTLEEKGYFFSPDMLIEDLGPVDDINITSAVPLLINDIRTGYESQDYDTEEGRTEYNNGQTWKTPSVAGKNTYDNVSEYRADYFGVNEVREKFLYSPEKNELKEDKKEDNDVFMLYVALSTFEPYWEETVDIDGTPTLVRHRQSYEAQTLDGIGQKPVIAGLSTKANPFNFTLSPKSNLNRKLRSVASAMYGAVLAEGIIELTKADKGAYLEYYLPDGETKHVENLPILVADLNDPLFMPFEITFETAFPLNFYKNFTQDNKGYVSFISHGKAYKLFVIEISFNIIHRSDFEIKGYICPNQDLTELFL